MNMIINRVLIILVAVSSVPARNIRRLPSAGIARSRDFNELIKRAKYIVPRGRMDSKNIVELNPVGEQFGMKEDSTNEPFGKNQISKLLDLLVNHMRQVLFTEHLHPTVHSSLPFSEYITRRALPVQRTDSEAADSSIPAEIIDEVPSSKELLSTSLPPPSIKYVECNSTAKHFIEIIEIAQQMVNSFQGSKVVLRFLVDVVREAIRGLEHFGGFENCQIKQNDPLISNLVALEENIKEEVNKATTTNIIQENVEVSVVTEEPQYNLPSTSETPAENDKLLNETPEVSDILIETQEECDKLEETPEVCDQLSEIPEESDKQQTTSENCDNENAPLSCPECKVAAEYFLKIITIARKIISSTRGLNSLSEYAMNIEKDAKEGLDSVKGLKNDQIKGMPELVFGDRFPFKTPWELPKLNTEAANLEKLFPANLPYYKMRIPGQSGAEKFEGGLFDALRMPKQQGQYNGIWRLPQKNQALGIRRIILIIPERRSELQNHLTFNLAPSAKESHTTQTIELLGNYHKDGGIVFGVPKDSTLWHQDFVH